MSFAFFRKYNKIILAVGGSLLMIIFLIPQAASSWIGQPGDQAVGRLGGREITIKDLRTADAEMRLVASLNQQAAMTMPRGEDANLRWMLMVEEARQQGLHSSTAHAQQILQAWQISDQQIIDIKNEIRATDAFIYQALRHWQMVMQLQQMVAGTLRVSEPAMRSFARNVQSNISVNIVPIASERLVDKVDEPTEEELQNLFAQNAKVAPGQSKPFGFGYRLPNRVKLEYIAVPFETVQKSVIISEVEANRYYLEHPDEFVPEVEGVLPDVKIDPLPYREVREKIIAQLADRKTAEKQDQIVKTIQAELAETTRNYERDGDSGYLIVGRLADFQAIALQIQRDYGVLPKIVRIEDRWIPIAEISDIDEFGGSFMIVGSGANRQAVPVAQYIALIREFVPAEMADRNPLAALRFQRGVPSQPTEDIAGNRYIFRVLETETSRPPRSLDEVREDVVRDAKLVKAYGMVKGNIEQYLASAREKGLEDFAGTIDEELQVEKIESFSRRDVNPRISPTPQVPNLPIVGRSAQFVDAVFSLAEPIEEAGLIDAVPADQLVGAVPVDAQLTVYITKVTDYLPVTSEEFAQLRPIYGQFIEQEDLMMIRDPAINPFTYYALATRVGYTSASEDRAAEQDDADTGEE
jgi:hypothetical protein